MVHCGPLRRCEGGGTRDHPEACRKRISRTTGAPIRSLSRSISMLRSRCSWCASAGLLAVTSSVPPVSLSALVSRSRCSPTACGHSHSACASRVRRVMPSAVNVLGSAAPMLRMNPTLLDPEDRGALQDALRQVVEVGRGDQGLGPWLECGQQALAARRVELGHHVIEEKHRLLAGHLGEIVQFRQLQAQHGAALLPLAGIEPGFMVVEPHLDIVALRSDSCLSTPDLLVARLTHGGLELFHDELQRRLADSGTRGPVAELEPLAVVAELAVKGGCDGLQLEQAALPLYHDRRSGFGDGGRPDVEPIDRLAGFPDRPQQGVALRQQVRVPIQLARVITIDLGEQRVEKASPALARTFDQLQVVWPEEYDPKRPDHIARAAWDPIDGELPRRS